MAENLLTGMLNKNSNDIQNNIMFCLSMHHILFMGCKVPQHSTIRVAKTKALISCAVCSYCTADLCLCFRICKSFKRTIDNSVKEDLLPLVLLHCLDMAENY